MIKIIIYKKENLICEFQIKGHSGYAEEGFDIVCAGVSVAGQMALVGLKEVLGLEVNEQINDGFMHITLCENDVENVSAQAILGAMEKTLFEISQEYSKFVKMEVREVCL